MEYLEDSSDTGQIEDGLFKFKSIKEHRSPYSPSSPADILSKHWEFSGIWPLLQPPLFWEGDTGELTTRSDRIFTIRMGSSLSLMDQGGTHNPNATLIGYPKEF